jgi:hypothetical protein
MTASHQAAAATPVTAAGAPPGVCDSYAASAWPLATAARAELLLRLDSAREACIDHAPFLAFLGALWLEHGDASQALLWLERSLLLAPEAPGAMADHALALAALGERTALLELVQRWRLRSDIPAALSARLENAVGQGAPLRPGPVGESLTSSKTLGWTWRRNLSLLRGHESNLDHSPRLSEITLSSPDGAIDLPLAVPFVPRAGRVWIGEGALQAQYSSVPGTLWQYGLQLAGRRANDEPLTDTRQIQLAAARLQRHDGWRSQWQASWLRVSGPLNEPYRTFTVGFSAERDWNGCGSRLGVDAEWRRQDISAVADSQTISLQTGINCSWSRSSGWSAGVALRTSLDRPRDVARPGGAQTQASLGLRAAGPIGAGIRLELSARRAWLADAQGYSPLLENNAVRRQRQLQLSAELSRPLPGLSLAGAEMVVQLQGLRQRSNLKLFEHQGASSFGGLRWDW